MSNPLAYDKVSLLRLAFPGLEDKELQEMATLTELRIYSPGHTLCTEGAYEDIFYVVAEGNIVVVKKLGDGAGEYVLRTGGKGELVGEIALIQHTQRTATVRTTTECTMLEMGKSDFETILSQSPHMAVSLIRIILDRIRANDQMAIDDLQKTNKLLQQLDRNKLEFIQVAAHELRTPLTVLKGYVSVLSGFPDVASNATLTEVLGGIVKGADRMHEVVNMMLDVTRIDSETLEVAYGPVFLKRIVNAMVHDFEKVTAERRIELTAQHAETNLNINADPSLVQKALYQLIINAIKYTPDGGKVLVSTRPIEMDDGSAGVEIAVKDSGIGLDAEQHELVFEKFYQVGSVALHSSGKTTFKGGGAGLGLALVRGIARAHGGKVWVESLGHDETHFPGCTFYLQLPSHLPDGESPALF